MTVLERLRRSDRSSGCRRACGQALVALMGSRPATSLFEAWLDAQLAGPGVVPRDRLVDQLAERWMRDELAGGAYCVDAMLWAPARIRREVEAMLHELEGDFVRTTASDGTPAGIT